MVTNDQIIKYYMDEHDIEHLVDDDTAVSETLKNVLPKESSLVDNVCVNICITKDQPIAGLNVSDKYLDITFKDISTWIEFHKYYKMEDIIK